MDARKYYEAYDDRYAQVHGKALRWFAETPSPIVAEVMGEYGISRQDPILEIGCGEGRDAALLLEGGFDLLATDVSQNAVAFCQEHYPEYAHRFHVLDCITDRLQKQYSFIYAVAVVHMLIADEDRDGFYRFIREQLAQQGIALVCSMGDGITERKTDPSGAFVLQERIHESTGTALRIVSTSYRSVSFETFTEEICRNGLFVLKSGLTEIAPDYGCMMYAVVAKSRT